MQRFAFCVCCNILLAIITERDILSLVLSQYPTLVPYSVLAMTEWPGHDRVRLETREVENNIVEKAFADIR